MFVSFMLMSLWVSRGIARSCLRRTINRGGLRGRARVHIVSSQSRSSPIRIVRCPFAIRNEQAIGRAKKIPGFLLCVQPSSGHASSEGVESVPDVLFCKSNRSDYRGPIGRLASRSERAETRAPPGLTESRGMLLASRRRDPHERPTSRAWSLT